MTKEEFNDLIVDLYHKISYQEEKAIITKEFSDLSNKDFHILDTIGTKEAKNMSSIAKSLNITVGTLTIAINNLLKKGYVIRKRGTKDRRIVYISLSPKGKKAFQHHKDFHGKMMEGILSTLTPEEEKALVKLLKYFYEYYETLN